MKRLAGFLFDIAAAQLGRKSPFKLTYVVTERCSCSCAICHLWQKPRGASPLADVERLFAHNPQLSWINLTGGDVVESDEFPAIARAAVRSTRVYALDFPTAGQMPELLEQRVRDVLALELPRLFVSVSLDGPEAVHDKLRGKPGAFQRALESIRRLRRLESPRLGVYAGLTLSSRNDADPAALVAALLREAPDLRRADLHFNLAHHAPHYYRNRAGDAPDPGRAAEFLASERRRRSIRGAFDLLEHAYWRLAPHYLTTGRSPVTCSALASSAYVDPELRLYPCATWDRPLVDLREVDYSLARALALAGVRAARAEAVAARCPGCWTPCEAYPALLTGLPAATRALLRRGPAEPAAATAKGSQA